MLRRKMMDALLEWKASSSKECLLIDGARQVGKSFIVREFGRTYTHYVELNLELHPGYREFFKGDLGVDEIVFRIEEHFGKGTVVPGDTLIFIDEIQSCPEARTSLKSFTMDGRYDVVASGSLLGIDYRKASSYPVGYERRITMNSLDFEEFLWAFYVPESVISRVKDHIGSKEPLDDYTLDLMNKYFTWYLAAGGMPAVVSTLVETREFDNAREKAIIILDGYRNDIGKYTDMKDRNDVLRCFRSIPNQLARDNKRFIYSDVRDDIPEIASESGDTPERGRKSGREYRRGIDWLIDSGACLRCLRVNEPNIPLMGDDRLFKIYVRDTGLLMAMYPPDVIGSILDRDLKANHGAIMENCMADLLNKAGLPLFYYMRKSTEVDFITDLGGTITGIEIKSGNNTMSKSLNSLMKRGMIQRGMKLEWCNIHVDGNGVEHYPHFAAGFMNEMFRRRSYRAERECRGEPRRS